MTNILLIFGGYSFLLGSYVLGALLLGSMAPLFIFMVMKGKSMKEESERKEKILP